MTARAPSVPAIGRASTVDIARIQTRRAPAASLATYASCEPSGESAMQTVSTVSLKAPPDGGGIANRTDGDTAAARSRGRSHDPIASASAIAATAHGTSAPEPRRAVERSGGDDRAP